MCDPNDLTHLDIIWSIVLESEIEQVYKPAVNLLVYSYVSVESSRIMEHERSTFLQSLIAKCFNLIKPEANPSAKLVKRVNQIIREVIS